MPMSGCACKSARVSQDNLLVRRRSGPGVTAVCVIQNENSRFALKVGLALLVGVARVFVRAWKE